MRSYLALGLVVLALAACAPERDQCKPATGAGACNLAEPQRACVCGWPPFWER